MDSADAVKAFLAQLFSPPALAEWLTILIAGLVALAVWRALSRTRAAPAATAAPPRPSHILDYLLAAAVILAPLAPPVAALQAGRLLLVALRNPAPHVALATQLVGALALVRIVVYVLGLLLGPHSWVRTREIRITVIVWLILALAQLGWLDIVETTLNHIDLVSGKAQFSL